MLKDSSGSKVARRLLQALVGEEWPISLSERKWRLNAWIKTGNYLDPWKTDNWILRSLNLARNLVLYEKWQVAVVRMQGTIFVRLCPPFPPHGQENWVSDRDWLAQGHTVSWCQMQVLQRATRGLPSVWPFSITMTCFKANLWWASGRQYLWPFLHLPSLSPSP